MVKIFIPAGSLSSDVLLGTPLIIPPDGFEISFPTEEITQPILDAIAALSKPIIDAVNAIPEAVVNLLFTPLTQQLEEYMKAVEGKEEEVGVPEEWLKIM